VLWAIVGAIRIAKDIGTAHEAERARARRRGA
jgi:hypothetical protein